MTDAELYRRGMATLVASWAAIAAGSRDASVIRQPGVAAAVFPAGPERLVYNNALLARGLDRSARGAALEAMEAAYASAGVARYAAWTHETDEPMAGALEARGYAVAETTRAMGMELGAVPQTSARFELAAGTWDAYRAYLAAYGLPRELLAGVDPGAFRVVVARLEGADVATGLAFDLDGDCSITNLSTLEHARGCGLGTAVTNRLVRDAAERGCRTASLQSTAAAERIYAAAGFRDLGRIVEYSLPEGSGERLVTVG